MSEARCGSGGFIDPGYRRVQAHDLDDHTFIDPISTYVLVQDRIHEVASPKPCVLRSHSFHTIERIPCRVFQYHLEVSCAGEAEGPTRLARGQAYFAYLKARHPAGWGQRLWLVEGVAHFGEKMVEAPCGVKALFATGTCKDE